MVKLFAILTVIILSLLVTLSINSQPAVGVVSGICVDLKSGQAIDGATVDITVDQSNAHDANEGSSDDSDAVPVGFTQGGQSDCDLDMAGHNSSPRTRWETVTDENGHFYFKNVYVGTYTISASSSGHDSGDVPLAISEGNNETLTLSMKRDDPSLSFNSPGSTWTTTETPIIGLHGLLKSPTVVFELDRLSIDQAMHSEPKLLIDSGETFDTTKIHGTIVRKWILNIQDADDEGSFYDQIDCGTAHNPCLPAGIYRLTAEWPLNKSIRDSLTFVVTDIAIVAKSCGQRILVQCVDNRTGKSIAGLHCWCFVEGTSSPRLLSSNVIREDGLCYLTSNGAVDEDEVVVVARCGDFVAGLELDVNSPGTTDDVSGSNTYLNPSSKQLRAFIYTDRPVYRPGNIVQMKGLSRWYIPGQGYVEPKRGTPVDITVVDAQNTNVGHQLLTVDANGSWSSSLTLSSEALTGGYTVTERVGDQSATGSFAVAAYHKPEFQVTVTFDKPRYIRGETIKATVTAAYYFGAPMTGATLYLSTLRSPSYGEDDSGSGEPINSSTIVLDDNGQAILTIPTADQDADVDQMSYTVTAEVDDKSGDSVTSNASALVAQGDFSLALTPSSTVANVGDTIDVTAVATDSNNAPIVGKRLHATAEYDAWQDGKDVLTPITAEDLTTATDGTANLPLVIAKAGLIDVTFTGTDSRGNVVTGQTQIWVPSKSEDIRAEYPDLAILLDKSKYRPGDIAHILITTSHPGPDSLVTVEGTQLYKALIVPLIRRATEVDLPVSQDYAPGITVEAACVFQKQYLSSSASMAIDDPLRRLNISITSDRAKYHPDDRSAFTIHTAGAGGMPISANVSVAVVDEAAYAIMPEQSETIQDAFQPEQSDNVETANSCETVYYGDVDKGSTNIDIRHKFPDTALWLPNITTDRQGNARISLTLPDTLTTWRITAYGQTASTMVGKGTADIVVNKDLSVRLETPPFLTAGDHSTIFAMVHNDLAKPMPVHLHLLPGGLNIQGELNQDFEVQRGVPTRLSWDVNASTPGTYHPEITVSSGALSDGVEQDLPVLVHGATNLSWSSGSLQYSQLCAIAVDTRADMADSSLTVRLSPTLSSSLIPAADYLSTYPFGSSDSTISALVSNAILYKFANALSLSEDSRQDIAQKANRSLLRTYRLQQNDGGWGWFSTNSSNSWMTANALWGLDLAKQAGLAVNPTIVTAAVRSTTYQANAMRLRKNKVTVDESAIALSALALAQNGSYSASKSNLQFLIRRWSIYPRDEKYKNVAAAALAEQTLGSGAGQEEAVRLVQELWSGSRETGDMLSWSYDYHSSETFAGQSAPDADTTAWALLAALSITPSDPRIDKAAEWLAANRNDDHWRGVDTTAVTVLALCKYVASTHELAPAFDAAVTINGHRLGTYHFGEGSVGDPERLIIVPSFLLQDGSNMVTLEKTGSGRLYYALQLSEVVRVAQQSRPLSFLEVEFDHLLHPPAVLSPAGTGFRIKRIYMRLTTRRNFLWEDTVPTPDWDFNTGDSILVRLIIDSTRPCSRAVIEEPVPAGCKIAETSGEFDENWDNWWDYTDVRDSDIVFFVSDLTTGRHEIDYHLVANREGSYDVMPTYLTSMSDPSVQASGMASKVDVDGD
jgi:alpha-2-macroglobulin